MHVLSDVVVPVVSAYLLLAGVAMHAARHPGAGIGTAPVATGWPPRLRLIVLTVGGGYVVFLGIVLVFHVWVAGQRDALGSALRGGTFLAAICGAAFLFGSALEAGRR